MQNAKLKIKNAKSLVAETSGKINPDRFLLLCL
jgi:hypothetical protein